VLVINFRCAAQPGPSFEAASLKLSAPSPIPNGSERGGPGSQWPNQWTCTNMPLSTLISRAWNLDTTTQLSGKADLDTARYDITAKVAPATSQAEFRLMIRHLLLEKLSLAVHIEPKE